VSNKRFSRWSMRSMRPAFVQDFPACAFTISERITRQISGLGVWKSESAQMKTGCRVQYDFRPVVDCRRLFTGSFSDPMSLADCPPAGLPRPRGSAAATGLPALCTQAAERPTAPAWPPPIPGWRIPPCPATLRPNVARRLWKTLAGREGRPAALQIKKRRPGSPRSALNQSRGFY